MRSYALARAGSFAAALALDDVALIHGSSVPASDVLKALDAAGNALLLARRPERAERLFRRAVALAPAEPGLLFNLAATLRLLDRTAEAERYCQQMIEGSGDAFDALKLRSELRRQSEANNHLEDLQRRIGASNLPWRGEVSLAYALGKECEDLGRYDQAFAAFRRGARVRREHMTYDVHQDLDVMSALRATFTPALCASRSNHVEQTNALQAGTPIFIVGLPRSGSTLLDRMLSRHPAIESQDEPQAFTLEVIRQVQQHGRPASREAFVAATAALDGGALRRGYLDSLAPLRGPRPYFIDKLPLNFLYLGLIASTFPDAIVVHMRREPLDVCLAMFKTLFEAAYPFSYDFIELAVYHRAYLELMAHWDRCFPERIVHVDYEALVAAPAPLLQGILARAGLPWDERCMEPHLHHAPALTHSAQQVREPIHQRSVGAWRNYEQHLAPLRRALGQ